MKNQDINKQVVAFSNTEEAGTEHLPTVTLVIEFSNTEEAKEFMRARQKMIKSVKNKQKEGGKSC